MAKKIKSLLFLFSMFIFVFQINAVKTRTDFGVKKVEPDKIQLKKGGKWTQIKISGKNLMTVEDVMIGKFRGKKFIKSGIKTKILKKRSSSSQLFIRISAGTKVNLGENYILRLLGKKVNKDIPFLDVPAKILKTAVVPLKQKIAVPLKAPLTSKKTLSQKTSPPTLAKYSSKTKIPALPTYSFSVKNLKIKNDNTPGSVKISGSNLGLLTSALIIYNGSESRYAKAELGSVRLNTREIRFTATSNAAVANNYKLRLMAGTKIINVPSVKFTLEVTGPKLKAEVLHMEKAQVPLSLQAAKQKLDISSLSRFKLKPDLIITPCQVEYVAYSHQFRIHWKIKNVGDADAIFEPNRTIAKYWQTDKDGNSTGSLEGGGSVPQSGAAGKLIKPGEAIKATSDGYNWSSVVGKDPGTYSFTYVADPYNLIDEKNENNNQKTCSYTVTTDMYPPPTPEFDVTITSVSVIPSTGPSGSTYFSFSVTVKNIGDAESPIMVARSELDYRKQVSVKRLAPNESVTVIIPPLDFLLPPGQKNVECRLGINTLEPEENNKSNNAKSVSFTVTGSDTSSLQKPDLIITPCQVEYVAYSHQFRIHWKIENVGDADAIFEPNRTIAKYWQTDKDGNSTGSLEGGGSVPQSGAAGKLIKPGEAIKATSDGYNWSSVVGKDPGTYSFTYVADPYNLIDEKNENNNQKTCSYTVTADMYPPPTPEFDVTITSVSVIPSTGPSGSTYFSFSVTVKNIGDAESPIMVARSELDYRKQVSVKRLAPNESVTVIIPPLDFLLPPGQKNVECRLGINTLEPEENNKSNNAKSVSFTVTDDRP